jgi:hypothetical protein
MERIPSCRGREYESKFARQQHENLDNPAMTFLNVTFDTQCLCPSDLTRFLQGGQMLRAVGILNARWEDFSALNVARDAGLTEVAWDCVVDETPGTLELTVWYPHIQAEVIRQRVAQIEGVEQYEIEGATYGNTEI